MASWAWDQSKQIGSGGFGRVYEASGPNGQPLAAKVVPKTDGASREHLIAQGSLDSPYVIPILHAQETDDSFILFMPRAEYSLRKVMTSTSSSEQAISILISIAKALESISLIVVHRDIKPDNILFFDGKWAICDFGIARYADASTASDTRKFSMSPYYAAPEQWRGEHATPATDIYAFGIMAYEILSGELPFSGTREELRTKHLTAVPPQLPGNRKLAWIISECMQKAPESRPTAGNLVFRLERARTDAATKGASSLAAAQSAIVEARAAEQAQQEAARTERERREMLTSSAKLGYSALTEELIEYITDAAPATAVSKRGGTVSLTLGEAELRVRELMTMHKTESRFDVICYGDITLSWRGQSRSHSLYFADFSEANKYSWYELAFMSAMNANFDHEPRSLPPMDGLNAFNNIFDGTQLAWGIVPLEIDDLDRFVDFWADRFGAAASGSFPRVFSLPDGVTRNPGR